jgi:tetratricopeptide (TPR) repeat protein
MEIGLSIARSYMKFVDKLSIGFISACLTTLPAAAQNPTPTPAPQTAQAYFARATATDRNSVTDIIADLSQAIRLKPDYAEAYAKRAELIWLGGTLENTPANKAKIKAAIADYSEVIRLQPNASDTALHQRAQLYAKLGSFQSAIADYAKLLSRQPNQPERYQESAELRLKTKDYIGAIADLSQAIKTNPNRATLYVQRAQAYSTQAQPTDAINDLTIALTKVSGGENQSSLYQARGDAQFKLGKTELALSDFNTAIQQHPANIQAHLSRGDTYAKLGKREAAIADFQKAAALLKTAQEDTFGAHKTFLQTAYKRQLNDIEQLKQNRSPKPVKTAEEFLVQGLRWVDRGDQLNATVAFNQAITLNPNLADAYVYRTTAAMLANFDYDSLLAMPGQPNPIADLTQAIRLQPQRVELYILRSTIYQVNSDYPKALADINQAIALSPQDVNLYLQRQNIHIVLGDTKAEQADVEQIRRLEASKK